MTTPSEQTDSKPVIESERSSHRDPDGCPTETAVLRREWSTLSRQRDALKAALEQIASAGSSIPKDAITRSGMIRIARASLAQLSPQGGENVPPVSCAEPESIGDRIRRLFQSATEEEKAEARKAADEIFAKVQAGTIAESLEQFKATPEGTKSLIRRLGSELISRTCPNCGKTIAVELDT